MDNFTVRDLVALVPDKPNALHLRSLSEEQDLSKKIYDAAINRPGLALVGFSQEYADRRIQIIGRGEFLYLESIDQKTIRPHLESMLQYELPCFIFCNNAAPPEYFQKAVQQADIPILITPLNSVELSIRILRALDEVFAPTQIIHAVFIEVAGKGILIQGESGIGKSETALELLDRGHRLIADDAVMIKCLNGNSLWGTSTNTITKHHMEIRGLGIIDVSTIFGLNSVTERKQIEMVCRLEEWDNAKNYNRLGVVEESTAILDVSLPCITLPVKPGRNIAIIIEAAVRDQRLKGRGIHSVKELNILHRQWLLDQNKERGTA